MQLIVLYTVAVKTLAILLYLSVFRHRAWVELLNTNVRDWLPFVREVREGAVPYVDVPVSYPVLTGSLYWIIAKLGAFLPLKLLRSTLIVQCVVTGVANVVNVVLFYRIAHQVNARSALRASLVLASSLTLFLVANVRCDAFLITTLLLGYQLHRNGRFRRAAGMWALGAGFSWIAALPLLAQELKALSIGRDPKRVFSRLGLFCAVQAALNAPFLLAGWLSHHRIDAWLASFGGLDVEASPRSLLGFASLWLGWTVPSAVAVLIAGITLLAIVARHPRGALAPKVLGFGIAASLLIPTDTAWIMVILPFALLIALNSSQPRMDWIVALYIAIDCASALTFPLLFADVKQELGALRAGVAADSGGAWTLLWSWLSLIRFGLLAALAREALRGHVEGVDSGLLQWPRIEPTRWFAWLRSSKTGIVLAVVFIAAQTLFTSRATVNMPRYSDEDIHFRQIERMCNGNAELDRGITMLPGFHVISAWLATALGQCNEATVRRLNVVWGLGATALGFLILLTLRSRTVAGRLIGIHFLPVAFPYYFCIYTDILALTLVLLAVYLALNERWKTAGVVGALGVIVRQTNALVLLLIALLALVEQDKTARAHQWLRAYASKTWTVALGVLGVAAFVYVNGGVAIGDRDRHEAGLHVGNLIFTLLLVGMVALPVSVERIWQNRQRLAAPAFWLALLVLYSAHMSLFKLEHPYNTQVNFLRNVVVVWAAKSLLTKTLLFVPVSFGFAAIWVTPMARRSCWVIVPVCLMSLLPEALVEQRYSIVPLCLWMLVRGDGSPLAEGLTATMNVTLSTVFVYLISNQIWSL